MTMQVTQRMRQAREDFQLSREEMAVRLDVDFNTIGAWERGGGKNGPPLWAIVGYARATGRPLAMLLEGERPSETELRLALLDALARERDEFNRRWAAIERRLSETGS